MPYTIFTTTRIEPEFVTRPNLEGGVTQVENPEQPPIPVGTAVVYTPETYNRFAADPLQRRLLLSDPNGKATRADILAAFPAYLDSLMAVVRLKAQNHILAAYPLWYQTNVALGIYGQPLADRMRDDIVAVIEESNRCEQLIYEGQPYTLNLPAIGGVQ